MLSKRVVSPAIIVLLILLVGLAPVPAQQRSLNDKVIERTLKNGLKVLMVNDPNTPLVECMLAFRVGSVNERPGITGVSHFHEHMMFKGTQTMGIKPGTLEKDNEYNRKIDALEAEIAKEDSKIKGRDEARLLALKKQVSDLITKEKAETIVSEEIWGAYQQAGGTGLNASTGKEMTHYYVTLPKNKVELFLALEADRLQNPVFREFYKERDVVMEERRLRTESQPRRNDDGGFTTFLHVPNPLIEAGIVEWFAELHAEWLATVIRGKDLLAIYQRHREVDLQHKSAIDLGSCSGCGLNVI